jgi:hypothetical protein
MDEEGEERTGEKLVCRDLTGGDLGIIANYLGGYAGAYTERFVSGLTGLSGGINFTGCPGGFSDGQCVELAGIHSNLTLHTNPLCRALGVRATKRFQRGQYRLQKGVLGTNRRGEDIIGKAYPRFLFWGGTTVLSDEIFGTGRYASSASGDDPVHASRALAVEVAPK